MSIESFIRNNHPDILEQYERYIDRSNFPAVGSTVIPLVDGYGTRLVDGRGSSMTVLEYTDNIKRIIFIVCMILILSYLILKIIMRQLN
jgi:hypothetical protein